MSAEFRDETTGRELAGLVIVVMGFGLLLNALGILPFAWIFARFWLPVMFVLIGIVLVTNSGAQRNGFSGYFFIGFGVLLFLARLNSLTFSTWQLLGPAIVIWIGISVLMKGSAFRPTRRPEGSATASSVNATALLGAFEQKSNSQQFLGGELTAVMGGITLDLRDAEIQADEAALEVFALMGGIEIIVPDRWMIQNRATAILGAVEDTTRPARDAAKRLVIRGSTLLGAIEVRN